ncbi:MAG: carbonic anhydrase [Gammaproteobacteria bacterium]|nr:carbonic anhydrase [Gammaproteobacteria bacterium]MCH9743587.1 carbonic anhydrase [Gammaproteobacteria bacterium]
MEKSFEKILSGYHRFREKYAAGDDTLMQKLASHGQQPDAMIVACCDSRVDPAVILQCDPGDLFTARNIANIIPPFEKDNSHHGTSAALEYGVCHLNVKHLIILGHSQCGGIQALLSNDDMENSDFISSWVSLVETESKDLDDCDTFSKKALLHSYKNCLSFPWIKQRVEQNQLAIHLWFFDISKGEISAYSFEKKQFLAL